MSEFLELATAVAAGVDATARAAAAAAQSTADGAVSVNTTQTSNIASNTTSIASKADAAYTVRAQTATTDTLVLSDMPANGSKLITESNASAITQTIPLNASVALPLNQPISFLQISAGQCSFANAGTMNVPTGFANPPKCRGQGAMVTAIQTATNVWWFYGDLAFV